MRRDPLALGRLFEGLRAAVGEWRGYLKKETQAHDSHEDAKLIPLHPEPLKDDEFAKYGRAMWTVFSDPKILNIAVSGPYGAGKSSVIARIREERLDDVWVTVSLAQFKGFDDNGKTMSSSSVEAEIINQMVHRVDLACSPKSRFKKIGDRRRLADVAASAALVCFALLTVSLWPLDIVAAIESRDVMRLLEFAVWATLAVFGVYKVLRSGAVPEAVKRLKFLDAEVEFAAGDSASPFDKCLADVIYLLNSAEVDVVVFEDLDRHGALPVFVKLRELNLLANDARSARKKPLRFFYLIKDSLFDEPRDRTKFFDFIVPVIPFVDPSNALDIFMRDFEEVGLAPNKGFLYQLSSFIDDPRLLREVVDESAHYAFALFAEGKMRDGDCERVVAMMAYKSLFPLDYECLQVKRGYVFNVLGRKAALESKLASKAGEDLESLRLRLGEMGEEDGNARVAVEKRIAALEGKASRLSSMTIRELVAEADDADILFAFGPNDIARPEDFKELHMGGVPASPSFPMLRFLICAGWIDESYERYMSNFYSESMSSRDAAYLSSLRQAAAVDRDFVPDDPEEIVARIDGPMAARAGARNIHLFKALLDGGGEEKLRQFMESLARDNDIGFLAEYVVSDQYLPAAFGEAIEYMGSPVEDFFVDEYLDDAGKRLFAKRFLLYALGARAPKTSVAAALKFANSDSLFLAKDERIDDEGFCKALESAEYRAKTIDFESCDGRLIEFVHRKGLFEPNVGIVVGFLGSACSVERAVGPVDAVREVISLDEGDCLRGKIEEEKELFVSSLLSEVKGDLPDDPDCALWILNDEKVDIERRREYVGRLRGIEMPDISFVMKQEFRTCFIGRGMVKATAGNVVEYFKGCGLEVDEALAGFVNAKGIPSSLTADFVSERGVDCEVLLMGIVRCVSIRMEVLERFLNQYGFKVADFGDADLDVDRVLALVEAGVLAMNAATLAFIRENYDSVVLRFAELNVDGYLDLVLPDESGVRECPFDKGEALPLLKTEAIGLDEKLRVLSGFDGAVAFSENYPEEVNGEIVKNRFDGDLQSAVSLCAESRGDLRLSLTELLSRNAAQLVDQGITVPGDIIDEVLSIGNVARDISLQMITAWAQTTKPIPSRGEITKRLEAASLGEYVKLLQGMQSMIPLSSADDAFLELLCKRRMCGTVSKNPNPKNLRRVYPKGIIRKRE